MEPLWFLNIIGHGKAPQWSHDILWPFEILANSSKVFSKVKQAVVNSSKHGINELLHELTNDLKLRILGSYRKWENIKKIAKVHRILVLWWDFLPK